MRSNINKIKIINKSNSETADSIISENPNESVFLNNVEFKNLAGKTFSNLDNNPKKRIIVKIKNSKNNIVIYRVFRSGNTLGISNHEMGLEKYNVYILGVRELMEVELEISKGSKILFFWNHPNDTIRATYKLTIIALLFTFLSLPSIILGFKQFVEEIIKLF